MSVEVLYETHATTVDNETGHATGWRGGELSIRGRAEAGELGERRRGGEFAAVFASDLRRAVDTVELAFAGSGVPVNLDARLRECDYGDLTGMPVARLEAERSSRVVEPFPGGESYLDVVARVRSFLRDLSGGPVLVVGHAATRYALDHLCGGVPLADAVTAPFRWQPGWLYVVR